MIKKKKRKSHPDYKKATEVVCKIRKVLLGIIQRRVIKENKDFPQEKKP
jgi:hypothetical protein